MEPYLRPLNKIDNFTQHLVFTYISRFPNYGPKISENEMKIGIKHV